jgi:hypothetical protein
MKFGAIVGLGGAALGGLASLTGGAANVGSAAVPGALTDASMSTFGTLGQAGSEAVTAGFSGGTTGLLGSAAPALSPFAAAPAMPAFSASLAAPTALTPGGAASTLSDAGKSMVQEAYKPQINLADVGDLSGAGGVGDSLLKSGAGIMDRFDKFGSFLGKNPELTKVGLGALDGMSKAKAAEAEFEARQRQLDLDRERYSLSITGQRDRL